MTRQGAPNAFGGMFFANLARTTPDWPWARRTLPHMTRNLEFFTSFFAFGRRPHACPRRTACPPWYGRRRGTVRLKNPKMPKLTNALGTFAAKKHTLGHFPAVLSQSSQTECKSPTSHHFLPAFFFAFLSPPAGAAAGAAFGLAAGAAFGLAAGATFWLDEVLADESASGLVLRGPFGSALVNTSTLHSCLGTALQ
eukprot:CAMPEP_0115110290 /NCGR_PEP_ID=MMETSP0227-20121206/39293_1 /TAXON_ID=89957 /ORGANISM="Polarella glacialis, Strain CCMP 1383" /LENGTH=195 /DNA_ID=CAMNT_0002509311 /DNA_START=88 /DNA_END=676 /DNA_ORIENTATION=-